MSIVLLWSDRGNDSDCQAPGFLCQWDSPAKKVGGGSDSIPQGIFPTQGLNPYPPHCRRILYHLSHQGSPVVIHTKVIYSLVQTLLSRWVQNAYLPFQAWMQCLSSATYQPQGHEGEAVLQAYLNNFPRKFIRLSSVFKRFFWSGSLLKSLLNLLHLNGNKTIWMVSVLPLGFAGGGFLA